MALQPIANYVDQPGLISALEAAGLTVVCEGGVFKTSDATVAASVIAGYSQLPFLKIQKQAALDAFFDARFDLAAFIRGGTATGVTAAGVGTFLATITNNYRTLRASIAAAVDAPTLAAINVAAGWPANP